MNMTQIKSLFILFSATGVTNQYQPLIDSAVLQVKNQLKEGADEDDERLDYLCAAIANYRYSQITCVRDKVTVTYAGSADYKGNSQLEYDFARELMIEYYKAAADLIRDDGFVFSTVGGGGDYGSASGGD